MSIPRAGSSLRKGYGALLRRDYFHLPYKFIRSCFIQRKLAADVADVSCISADRLQAVDNALFEHVVLEGVTDAERALIEHVSFQNYFHVTWRNSGCTITDRHPDTPFFQRQAMLATVYEIIGSEVGGLSLCDLGGSNGYYSFLAESFGFKELTVCEARDIHRQQFELIKRKIATQSKIAFHILDVSRGITGTYDIVLAQGLLYHLYDHLRFLEDLYRAANKYVVLETAISARMGFLDLTEIEDVKQPRTGTLGISIYPSYATVLALLHTVGFKRISRILPPKGVADSDGYRTGFRVMLFAEK